MNTKALGVCDVSLHDRNTDDWRCSPRYMIEIVIQKNVTSDMISNFEEKYWNYLNLLDKKRANKYWRDNEFGYINWYEYVEEESLTRKI